MYSSRSDGCASDDTMDVCGDAYTANLNDCVLRVVGAPGSATLAVTVNSFLMARSCEFLANLFRLSDAPSLSRSSCGRPIYTVQLDAMSDAGAGAQYTREAVALFFRLIVELNARSFSDSMHDPARVRAANAQHHHVVETAKADIIAMHALAQRFGCIRVERWVIAQLPELLSDENAAAILDYAIDPMHRSVRAGCAQLYETTFMWLRCIRPPTPALLGRLDEAVAWCTTNVANHGQYDIFKNASRLVDGGRTLEITGCLVKCQTCYEHKASTRQGPDKVVIETGVYPGDTGALGTHGFWSMHVQEEICIRPRIVLAICHVPAQDNTLRSVLPCDAPTGAGDCATGARTLTKRESDAVRLKALTTPTAAQDHGRAYKCVVEACSVRQGSRSVATFGEMTSTSEPFLIDTTTAHATSNGTPSLLWQYRLGLPVNYGYQEVNHTGFCPHCRQTKPLFILSARLRVAVA